MRRKYIICFGISVVSILVVILFIILKKYNVNLIKFKSQSLKNAEEVYNNPLEFYGKKVTNYQAPNEVPVGWKIFHSDGENIYLIADNYLKGKEIPVGRKGTKVALIESLSLPTVANDYAEVDNNFENHPAKKWLSKYYESGYDCLQDRMNQIKFLMDTEAWSVFQSDKAEYVIAGPTLEMFVESYNVMHPEKQIDIKPNKKGYDLKWSTDPEENYKEDINGFDLNEFDNLYIISSSNNRGGMVIISYEGEEDKVLTTYAIDFKGELGWSKYNCMMGLRPIICLKKDVKLEKVDNESYIIK